MATSIRTVALRIGLVLSTQGGAMEKMMLPLHLYTGTYFGNGRQYYSWIHIDDLCRMFIWALENEQASGIYNAVAPNPETNKALTKSLARAMGKSAILLPAPAAALRIAMGEMADVVLTSARVSAEKITQAGFDFQHVDLERALRDLIKRKV